jgi:5-methylcytosine-specific restriction endonuclease McrA
VFVKICKHKGFNIDLVLNQNTVGNTGSALETGSGLDHLTSCGNFPRNRIGNSEERYAEKVMILLETCHNPQTQKLNRELGIQRKDTNYTYIRE